MLTAPMLAVGCGGKTGESPQADVSGFQKITPAQAKEMMDGETPYILLDVRAEDEFIKSRIDGAVLIPHTEIKTRASAALPDKDAVILVYCAGGIRSANAARNLARLGYTNVYDFGGIQSWPYETVSGVIAK